MGAMRQSELPNDSIEDINTDRHRQTEDETLNNLFVNDVLVTVSI